MKPNWQIKDFEDCLDKVIYTKKIQKKDFLQFGKFPIVSQEAENINGYWNDVDDLFEVDRPLIIFGDHTKVIKYVDFDFVLGADGVKILKPKTFLDCKFFFHFMKSLDIKSLGYARHYKLLREIKVAIPPLPEQLRIVKILDKVFEKTAKAKENTLKKLTDLEQLNKSVLVQALDGNL